MRTTTLLELVDAVLTRQDATRQTLFEAMADRFGEHADRHRKRLKRAASDGEVTLELADRVLVALGLTLHDLPDEVLGEESGGLRRRGGGKPGGVYGYLTDVQVRACHALYMQGRSLRQVAAAILPKTRYRSARSCANGLHGQFVRLGLPRRDRIAATVAASMVHGLSRDRHHRRGLKLARGEILGVRCAAATVRSGEHCRRPALKGGDYCFAHEPERRVEIEAILAKARSRRAA